MTLHTPRRSALCVPGSSPAMVAKACASSADEVVVDLEDAVAIDAKDGARAAVSTLGRRDRGTVSVRVNAEGTPWHAADLVACANNTNVNTIVVPKVESGEQIRRIVADLEAAELQSHRTSPLGIQALIESPRAVQQVADVADSHDRMTALVIGYADLAASLGRHADGPWQFARDAVLVAARSTGIHAIDGPHLTVADDEMFAGAVALASGQGFDGKWVIHPRQLQRVNAAFTPTADEVREAAEIVAVMEHAQREGTGAVAWQGRMLDEALVVAARRTLARGTQA